MGNRFLRRSVSSNDTSERQRPSEPVNSLLFGATMGIIGFVTSVPTTIMFALG